MLRFCAFDTGNMESGQPHVALAQVLGGADGAVEAFAHERPAPCRIPGRR